MQDAGRADVVVQHDGDAQKGVGGTEIVIYDADGADIVGHGADGADIVAQDAGGADVAVKDVG